jgi:hypothetical protein
MTEVTRDVISDLLPVYFSGEASEQTRRFVDAYFERDSEFARMARGMGSGLPWEQHPSLEQAHRRSQLTMLWRGLLLFTVLAFIGSMTLIALLFLVMR